MSPVTLLTSVFGTSSGSTGRLSLNVLDQRSSLGKKQQVLMKKQLTSVWFPQAVNFSTLLQGLAMGQNHLYSHSLGAVGTLLRYLG